jgi:hypothetical protein
VRDELLEVAAQLARRLPRTQVRIGDLHDAQRAARERRRHAATMPLERVKRAACGARVTRG